jgi:hypothetical protein
MATRLSGRPLERADGRKLTRRPLLCRVWSPSKTVTASDRACHCRRNWPPPSRAIAGSQLWSRIPLRLIPLATAGRARSRPFVDRRATTARGRCGPWRSGISREIARAHAIKREIQRRRE